METGGPWFKTYPAKSYQDPYLENKLDKVAHVYNPSYSGGGDKKIMVRGQSRQKPETLSEK
jgi:hypothetical protein